MRGLRAVLLAAVMAAPHVAGALTARLD
ncbi:MAG: hypothetical protein K0R58_2419, partial [Ramlibacter sp.]|nr:hypothetical protein [Ramlibacter sp.]